VNAEHFFGTTGDAVGAGDGAGVGAGVGSVVGTGLVGFGVGEDGIPTHLLVVESHWHSVQVAHPEAE